MFLIFVLFSTLKSNEMPLQTNSTIAEADVYCNQSFDLLVRLKASIVKHYPLELWQLEMDPTTDANVRTVNPAKWCYLLPK